MKNTRRVRKPQSVNPLDLPVIQERVKKREAIKGPRPGDWVILPNGSCVRLVSVFGLQSSVERPRSIMTGDANGWLIGESGNVTYYHSNISHEVSDRAQLIDTGQTKAATFIADHVLAAEFGIKNPEGYAYGGRFVVFELPCRVYRLEEPPSAQILAFRRPDAQVVGHAPVVRIERPWHTEITVFKKLNGGMSKRIWLGKDGKVVSDGSTCAMSDGEARRVAIESLHAFAELISHCPPYEAIALGRLKPDLLDTVRVAAKDKLVNRKTGTIARSKDNLVFAEAGVVLLDHDTKAMSEAVKQCLDACGGLLPALCSVLPALKTAALVERASTSSGLRHGMSGKQYPSSGGKHLYVPVCNAADIPRFLSDLYARCWLAGLGWGMASAAGTFLERSIVDKSVGSPERLIFEGRPIVDKPLIQESRQAIVRGGHVLDTKLFAPLTASERAQYEELLAAERVRLEPELKAARFAWGEEHVQRLIARGATEAEALAQVVPGLIIRNSPAHLRWRSIGKSCRAPPSPTCWPSPRSTSMSRWRTHSRA